MASTNKGIISREDGSITFTVNEVQTAEKLLSPATMELIIKHRCGGIKPEAVSPFPRKAVMERDTRNSDQVSPCNINNGLIAALHLCWSNHYPLVLTPDMIWLSVAQGFAHHVNANAEKLRDKFVEHEGKKTLEVRRSDLCKGSPNNPWSAILGEFSEQIRKNVGDKVHSMLTPSFSTTTPVEKAAAQVVLMNTFKTYFNYAILCICGIPAITLQGTVRDWEILKEKVSALTEYDLNWWVDSLIPILDQFISAASGNIDCDFWHKIYQQHGGKHPYSPGPYVTGWILSFFPYYESRNNGSYVLVRNEYLNLWSEVAPTEHNDDDRRGLTHRQFLGGVVSVPFIWTDGPTGREYNMNLYSGFMVVSQDPESKALRPEIGWAVADEEEVKKAIEKKSKGRGFF